MSVVKGQTLGPVLQGSYSPIYGSKFEAPCAVFSPRGYVCTNSYSPGIDGDRPDNGNVAQTVTFDWAMW